MAVISTSGQSIIDIAKIINKIVFPSALIVAFFSLYITPSATEYRYKLEHRLNSEERIEEIRPGRFTSSQNGEATFFVESTDDEKLNNIFFSSSDAIGSTIENSKSASYFTDNNNLRFILLKDGTIVEVLSSINANTRTTTYDEHGIMLGQELSIFTNTKFEAKSTYELFLLDSLESKAELQSRLMLPLATIILGLLALPLSYSAPRKGRYDKVFLGALIYFTYFIGMSITKKMFLLEITPTFLGLWWLHLVMVIVIVGIYYQDKTKIPGRQ